MNNIPAVTKNLLIINILFFAGQKVATLYGIDLTDELGLHFFLANNFCWYQLFSYMFLHGGFEHLFFNMFALWMFGRTIEHTMGQRRFLFYYLTCGLGAGIMQECAQYAEYLWQGYNAYEQVNIGSAIIDMGEYLNRWTTVGASGAIYGILLAFGMTFPDERIFIFPIPIPIKAKFFVCGYAVIELLSAMARSNDGVAHIAHLGGMLFGLLLILYWRKSGGGNRGGNGYYGGYYNRGQKTWYDVLREWLEALLKKMKSDEPKTYGGKYEQDIHYRQQKKEEEEEMDRILDKVKKNGYDTLTEEEKKRLFDFSKKM